MSLKQELERDPGASVRIKLGGPGSLDILADGKLVFSKQQTGRVPTAAEVRACLKKVAPS